MKKLAFITSEEDPNLINDDQLAIGPLEKLGYLVAPLVWDHNSQIDGFDALIFRSCWNYHRKFEQFAKWVTKLKTHNLPVLNSINVSIWNLNKKYLLELAEKGIPIPRTAWFPKGTSSQSNDIKEKIKNLASDRLVIRPAVSLNGHDTYLVSLSDTQKFEEVWNSLPADRDILVQEFIPEIQTAGETSLVFFNGEFSHAIRKTAADHEFRIHSEYGGKRFSVSPHADLVAQAKRVIDSVGEPLLFARVDLVDRPQGPVLIELELVDPMLFLGFSEGAPERFAQAIAYKLS